MKKLIPILVITLMVMTACSRNSVNNTEKTKEVSTRGYYYTLDTICNGHVYMFDRTGMMEHPECPKCKENLVFLLDSLIDDRVVKLLGIELNEK